MSKSTNKYQKIIQKIFFDKYTSTNDEITFERDELIEASKALGFKPPKNLGDIIYAIRYRTGMPDKILKTQPNGWEWIIEGGGIAKYIIKLVKVNRIIPNGNLITIKIPDATPEIVTEYALSDEQALLAKVRYNRLIDIFLGVTTYSLQNHLRTTVKGVGQIEIDEIYVGVDQSGCQYVIPVQAKGGNDQLSVVQTKQDILCCSEKYPTLITRAISTQFLADDLIALFELAVQDDLVKLVQERHYRLVPGGEIKHSDLELYKTTSKKTRL